MCASEQRPSQVVHSFFLGLFLRLKLQKSLNFPAGKRADPPSMAPSDDALNACHDEKKCRNDDSSRDRNEQKCLQRVA